MEIRAFTVQDALEALSLWNLCLCLDQLDIDNFYRRVVYDVNFDPSLYFLAVENDRPLGFAYGIRRKVYDEIKGLEPEHGWIVAMGVHPSHRGQGIGSALLEAIEKLLKERGVSRLDVGPYGSAYFCPGIDRENYPEGVKFFSNNGYTDSGESCSMRMDLWGFEPPPQYSEKKKNLEKRGFSFRPFTREDTLTLFSFMEKYFPSWLPAVRSSILQGKAEKTLITALEKNGAAAGFVLRGMDGTDERFGPFGIRPDLQGIGIGSVLFYEMIENMIHNRIFHAYFVWTSGRNLEIYGSWGMKIFRRFAMFYKILS
jgi:GNAT superfamily N-acetyltransferase